MFNSLEKYKENNTYKRAKSLISLYAKTDLIESFDTETINANLALICSTNNYLIVKDNSILDFLFYYAKRINFFYNMKYDVYAILKHMFIHEGLTREQIKEMYENKRYVFKGYEINYVNNKSMTLRRLRDKREKRFYDIAQFYNKLSLENAANKYLHESKNDKHLGIDRSNITKIDENVIKYCMNDAQLTKKLAENFINMCISSNIYVPRKFYSPAYLAHVQLFRNNLYHYVRNSKFDQILDIAYKTYHGGMFSINYKGLAKNITKEDINSAYPYAMTFLPLLNNFEIVKVNDINKDAIFGFYKVKCQYNGFMPYKSYKLLKVIYPKTKNMYTNYLTKVEIDAYRDRRFEVNSRKYIDNAFKTDSCDIDVIEGYEIYSNDYNYKLKDYIEKMYDLRIKLKKQKDQREIVIKTVLNSIYGKFAQRNKDSIGALFNSVYASYVTAIARILLYERSYHYEKVYMYATDSIMGVKSVKNDENDDYKLGKFKLEEENVEYIILQNGLYMKDGKLIKSRGISQKNLDFSIENDKIVCKMTKVMQLPECILHHTKNDIKDINLFKTITKEISYTDNKKICDRELTYTDLCTNLYELKDYDDDYVDAWLDELEL